MWGWSGVCTCASGSRPGKNPSGDGPRGSEKGQAQGTLGRHRKRGWGWPAGLQGCSGKPRTGAYLAQQERPMVGGEQGARAL